MSGQVLTISDDSFDQEVLGGTLPILVDFWAEWCGPCKAIGPILKEVAEDPGYDKKISIAKINIDENSKTPSRYGVRGIPTLMLFKDGRVIATKVGSLTKSQLTAFIDSHL